MEQHRIMCQLVIEGEEIAAPVEGQLIASSQGKADQFSGENHP